jgi:hypothetical protein
MRRWLTAARMAGSVAERPASWLPGGLAWVSTLGWISLVLPVVPPPSQSALTYFGAGMRTSGAWPLNLVLLVAGILAVAGLAAALGAIGSAVLIGQVQGRGAEPADVGRLLGASIVFGLPALAGIGMALVAFAAVAPAEFNRGGAAGDPVLRTLLRVAPLLAFTALLAAAGQLLAGVAGRISVRRRSLAAGIVRAPAAARRLGAAGAIHGSLSSLANFGYVGLAALMVAVLWPPIGARLGAGEAWDPGTMVLLVGFVAIWLCLVLGGGALHAWSTATWSHLDDSENASMESGEQQAAWKA